MTRLSDLINKPSKEEDKKKEKELEINDIESKYHSFFKFDKQPSSPEQIKSARLVPQYSRNKSGELKIDSTSIEEVNLNTHSVDKASFEKVPKEGIESENPYNRAMDILSSSLSLYMEKGKIDIDRISTIPDEFITSLRDDASLVVNALFLKSTKFNLIQHQIDVAVFALKIGISTGLEYEKLKSLSLGALLHDIGFIRISDSIISKSDNLTNEEITEIKKHPLHSRDIISEALGDGYSWLGDLTCLEHEKEDGSGYPFGLSGDQIDPLAKIIGISDIYEALTHPRPQRNRMTPFDAVKIIITSFKRAFPRNILKAVVSELSAFPVGSYVLLNSQKVARVLEVNPLSPLKPKVEILYDSTGRKLQKKEVVDLNRDSLLNITGPVFYEDLHG